MDWSSQGIPDGGGRLWIRIWRVRETHTKGMPGEEKEPRASLLST
jgi:hypothetical protein